MRPNVCMTTEFHLKSQHNFVDLNLGILAFIPGWTGLQEPNKNLQDN